MEVSYQVIVCPWCIVQPDLQYVFQPDGAPTSADGLQDALVLGVRTEISF